MFREMRRIKQKTSVEECQEILINSKRGVLSVYGDDGYPYGIPVNFYYDKSTNIIYLHGAKEGHKIDAIKKCNKVCFTTWNEGYQEPNNWWWHIRSVVAMGKAEFVVDEKNMIHQLRNIGKKYFPETVDIEKIINSSLNRVGVIAIKIEHLTGKDVKEK